MGRKIVVSDLHLGGGLTRVDELRRFLDTLSPADSLWVNGDLVDATAGVEFTEDEMSVWDTLSDLARAGVWKGWVSGNHDPEPQRWAHLVNVPVFNSLVLEDSGSKILLVHGHLWDPTCKNPHDPGMLAVIWAERVLAKISVRFTRWIKGWEQSHRSLDGLVRDGAVSLAMNDGLTCATAGHTHNAMTATNYVNSGCWCGSDPPACCRIVDGRIILDRNPVPAKATPVAA